MKSNSKTFNLTQLALFSALIILMTFTPIGYITIPALGLSATVIHIPAIIGTIVTGTYGGLVLGCVWGLSCIARALTMATGIDLFFVNPLVSLIPRVIVCLLASFVFKLMIKLMANKKQGDVVAYITTGVVGTLTNTVLVLTALSVLFYEEIGPAFTAIINTISAFNGIVEIVSAVILVPAICKALIALKKRMGV